MIDGGVLAKAGGNVAFNVASALAMAGLSRCFDREVLGHDMLQFCPAEPRMALAVLDGPLRVQHQDIVVRCWCQRRGVL